MHSSVKFNNLLYHYKDSTKDKDFSMYNDAKCLFDMTKHKNISLSRAVENQADLESNLTNIKIGDKKTVDKKKVIKNVEKFSDSGQVVINFHKDYSSMVINAAYDTKQQEGTGLKILTPKKTLQRLSIALAQIKARNNSENVCSYHVTYAFQSESTLYSCLNVKELLARSRLEI